MIKKNIIFLITIFSLTNFFDNNYSYAAETKDFPTLARSEFVFACMSSNANNRDFMAKCSCAIDEIAKRLSLIHI